MRNEGYTPFRGRITKAPVPIERLFEFMRGPDRFACELRDTRRYGVEAQFFKNDEFLYSHRWPSRELATLWAEQEREAICAGHRADLVEHPADS